MRLRLHVGIPVMLAMLAFGVLSVAQQQPQQAQPELYHVHFVKAAAGKLPQLMQAYQNAPGPEQGEPQVAPIVLRHREGAEWDLVVIRPLGKQTTISATAPPEPVQAFNQRVGPLTDWHSDTFVLGPPSAAVQKALVPAKGAEQSVYVVSDYRSLPGHRTQLRQVLDRNAQDAAGRMVIFAHVEGAPWNFLTVTRYDSWADLGAAPAAQASQQQQQEPGLAIREHLAVHHDTIATRVGGGSAMR